MSNKLRENCALEEDWVNRKLTDERPCNTCDIFTEYKSKPKDA